MIKAFSALGLSLLCYLTTFAQTNPINPRSTVPAFAGDLRVAFVLSSEVNPSEQNLKIKCDQLQLMATSTPGGIVLPTCQFTDIQKLSQRFNAPLSSIDRSDYVFYVWEDITGEYHIHVRNRHQEDLHEFKKAEWRIQSDFADSARKIIANVLAYERSKESLKEFFLQLGSQDSKTVRYIDGQYFSWPEKNKLNWKQAYQIFVTESDRTKNYMRTSLEITVSLLAGVAWYYQNFDFNAVDFDYPQLSHSLRTRFTSFDAIRFDNNGPGINRKHIYPTGVGYYLFARSNG